MQRRFPVQSWWLVLKGEHEDFHWWIFGIGSVAVG